MAVFISREKALVAMIGTSLRRNPYQIQRPRPQNNMIRKKSEMSSAFLFRKSLINCGSNDTAVKIPAITPTHSVVLCSWFKRLAYKRNSCLKNNARAEKNYQDSTRLRLEINLRYRKYLEKKLPSELARVGPSYPFFHPFVNVK